MREPLGAHELERLMSARAEYLRKISPYYDEVLNEVAELVHVSGSIGKLEIGGLLFWKRLRANTSWVADLMKWPDRKVRAVTAVTVQAATDSGLALPEAASRARASLSGLPGFDKGDALASALILAAAPRRMAIYDRRAHSGLRALGIPLSDSRGRYARYMEIVDDLAQAVEPLGATWSARDVDVALYWLGR